MIDKTGQMGVPVIFTRYVYSKGMVDFGPIRGIKAAARVANNSLGYGTDEIELIDELDVQPDEIIIDKSRPSSFGDSRRQPA